MSVDTDKSRAWAQDVICRAERSATVEGEMSLATIGAYLGLMAESLEEVSPLARTVIAQAGRIDEIESSLKLVAEDAERWHRLFDEGATATAKIAAELEAVRKALAAARDRFNSIACLAAEGPDTYPLVGKRLIHLVGDIAKEAGEGYTVARDALDSRGNEKGEDR